MAEYYRYEKYLKYINGVPADPPEYKQGELIGTGEYDSLSDCESDAIYEWRVYKLSDYICDGYSSYYKEYKYKSLDNGLTWTRTSQTRKGELKNLYATECGWSLLEKWTSTGVTRCSGSDLMEELVKEVSYDMGETWIVSQPAEYIYIVKERWYKDCVLELPPLEFEVTIEESDVPIWIEIETLGLDPYFINWGESEHTAEYAMDWHYKYIMTDENSLPFHGAPFSYTYAKAGTYTIKLWVNNIKIIGGVWRCITQRNPDNPTHVTLFKYTDKYTYKIKSFGNLPNSYLEGINLSGTPLTELCSDEYGFLGGENFTSCILTAGLTSLVENVRHFKFDAYAGADYTVTTLVELAFDVANTKLTTIPLDIFKYATYMGGVRFANCRILSIPKELFVNCVGLLSCALSFRVTDITDIPEGLFDSCTNLISAYEAFRETNIVNCPRLWTNYPTITSYMFYNCKLLESIASTFKVNMYSQQYMFYGCTKLSNPQNIINNFGDNSNSYNISYMYLNSGVTSIPYNLFSLLSTYELGSGYIDASYMFEGCKNLLNISGTITILNMSTDLHHMFANSGLTSIDLKFPNILTTNDANCLGYMFEGCVDLTTLNTDMFNFNATSLDILYMFKDCKKLTNWPIAEEHNLWDYPCFYNPENLPNHIDYQYTFTGCSKIASEVPIEFGGYKSPYAPVIILTDATSITITGSHASTIIRVEGGDTYSVPQTLTLPEGTSTIYIYVTTGTWRVTSDTYYKILDFGGGGMISGGSDPDYITYLGTDQGAFKATTKFPLTRLKNVEEVSVDFLKSGTNINSVEELFRYNKKLTSIPEGTFSKLTNLSGADWVCNNSNILNVDGMFEGCANLISAYEAFGDCNSLVSALRTFKDCTSLSDIRNVFGVNPQYIPLAVNCNQLFENTAVTKFSPNMSRFLKLSSAIGMFRNNSKLTKVDCKFTLVGDNVDVTEMFKDCPLLESQTGFSISEGSTANFTRCWLNCAVLSLIPTVQYAGKTVNPWEVPNAVGTECFNGCTLLLERFGDLIPDGWK